jgi:hypothetical protein
MFQALDAWAVKNKDKFFTGKLSKFAKIYDYTPIVRKPQEVIPLDDDDDNKPKVSSNDKPHYAKVKINTDWQSKEVSTTVFLREDGVPVKQEVKTVSDLANIVTWNSTIKMICCCNKLWFGKSADKSGRRQFGIAFKILQCEVSEKVGGSAKNDFTSYAFDDEVKIEEKKEQSATTTTSSSEKVESKVEQSDDDDDDDDDDDEDEDEKPVASKKVETKAVESDDDSEDSDEEDTKQTKGKKKPEGFGDTISKRRKELGLGNTTAYSSPKQVGSLTTWGKVSAGSTCTIALKY